METVAGTLGRRVPPDWRHVEQFALRCMDNLPKAPAHVEFQFAPPDRLRPIYNQGQEGACVGFSSSWMMSILNGHQYDPRWLWNEAKKIDEWPDTNPGDDSGTSVRAAMDILRGVGHVQVVNGQDLPPDPAEGVANNRWATQTSDVRLAIGAMHVPCVIGCNWHSNFDTPKQFNGEWWIGRGKLGSIRGGHAICIFGWSDSRKAVRLVNSWGTGYPDVWLPRTTLARLLKEEGECTMVTDR
jgi:hypothetical protein